MKTKTKHILYHIKKKTLTMLKSSIVVDNIYFMKVKLPTEKQVTQYLGTNNTTNTDPTIKSFFKNKSIKNAILEIKQNISKIDHQIPLYDEYSRNLYIIPRNNVYNRVVHYNYRFPDNDLYDTLKKKYEKMKIGAKTNGSTSSNTLGDFDKDTEIINRISHHTELSNRRYRKLSLMIDFLKNFDLTILNRTYIYVFYNYSNEIGKNITICLRPSFLPHFTHINPYYTRSELINLALNMELIKFEPDRIYKKEETMKLCKIIKKNDISANTIKKHQSYIVNNNGVGILQYYSLQGSFFINQYLRKFVPYKYKNPQLEKNIRYMWDLAKNAPAFDKEYILYRFVKDDGYLRHLKVGGTFITSGFTSTTRDPFYRSDVYKFGFVLIKIKIPKNVKGVALCMETMSHFPEEQEIILPPHTHLRLDKKDKNAIYYHTDKEYNDKLKTRYEFTLTPSITNTITLAPRPAYNKTQTIDFLKINKIKSITINEKINYFIAKHVNPYFQFKTKIGNKTYDIVTEWYDSTTAYKNFYAVISKHAFLMNLMIDSYMECMIELGAKEGKTYMYVNYYFKYSTVGKKNVSDDDLINFISKIAFYFEINQIVIYADYSSCDLKKSSNIYYGENYCTDFYNYFKSATKKYKTHSSHIRPKFSYYQLDRLIKTDPLQILRHKDRDEIYQIYVKAYKKIEPNKNNLASFYVWIVENYCRYANMLTDKMKRLYKQNNPFTNDYYVLDPMSYLYNNQLIDTYPIFETTSISTPQGDIILPTHVAKNQYRINLDPNKLHTQKTR